MLRKLSERVYIMPNDSSTDRPALGIIAGDERSLIVDGGNSAQHASQFLSEVAKLGLPPVRWLAVTHWHWDHTFGAERMGLPVIAHRLTNEKLRWMRKLQWDDASLDARVRAGTEIEFCAANIKKEHPDRSAIHIKTADIEYDGRLSVDLGGVTCSIFRMGGEHSADSTVIYSPEAKAMFLGDGLCQEMFTGEWSYDLGDFKSRLKTIKGLSCDWYINSHWAPQPEEDFREWCGRMIDIGTLCGDLTDFDRADEAYAREFGVEPDPDAKFMLDSFVWGNIKKMKRTMPCGR